MALPRVLAPDRPEATVVVSVVDSSTGCLEPICKLAATIVCGAVLDGLPAHASTPRGCQLALLQGQLEVLT